MPEIPALTSPTLKSRPKRSILSSSSGWSTRLDAFWGYRSLLYARQRQQPSSSGLWRGGRGIADLHLVRCRCRHPFRLANGAGSQRPAGAALVHDSRLGSGNFERYIEDSEQDEIGELGQNLNRVAADLQTLLADKEKIAVLEERDRYGP